MDTKLLNINNALNALDLNIITLCAEELIPQNRACHSDYVLSLKNYCAHYIPVVTHGEVNGY